MITIDNFLNPEEVQRINATIALAEKSTAGEIKPLVVQDSSSFPGDVKERTLTRANAEFFIEGLDHTTGHTGILIMISLEERRVEVRAGKSISEFYDQKRWKVVVDTITSGIKKGDAAEGICDAIIMVGRILSKHFPIQPGDVNEIPDTIIFKK